MSGRSMVAKTARRAALLAVTRGAAALLLATVAIVMSTAGVAVATGSTDYTATQTIPVPPASTYAGSGGGDGWAVAMTPAAVYNVFHHQGSLQVACHLQRDASPCWDPRTIVDVGGNGFATSGQPGLWLDERSAKLYVYATRTSDQTGGVLCIDTSGTTAADMFCGFTALTLVGESPVSGNGAISMPALIGSRWYAFNYADSSGTTSSRNAMLCFDLQSKTACGGQPYEVATGGGILSNSNFPSPAVAAIGHEILIPVVADGSARLACLDGVTQKTCSGTWPMLAPSDYVGNQGAVFPLLDNSGAPTGFCVPNGTDPCFTLSGSTVKTPDGLAGAITATTGWNGPAIVLGPRVYVANGNSDQVQCYDYNTKATCKGFPRAATGANYIYTVNTDPQRPDCIWVNADTGSGQIQNFNAYTGASCGQGPIRVLASKIVVPTQLCTPNSYQALQVLAPGPDSYSDGTVTFLDGDAQRIPGAADRALDATGKVDLRGLSLNTDTGLPQFLITLNGARGTPGAVTVKLSWRSSDDVSCRPASLITMTPSVGAVGTTFTVRYSCPTAPKLVVTTATGAPAPRADLGLGVTGNGVDYVQAVTLAQVGEYAATVTCSSNSATTRIVKVTDAVANTFGPGWPKGGDDFTLNWSYGGGHRYLGNVIQGASNWTAAGTRVHMQQWAGGSAPVHVSLTDINVRDDYLGITLVEGGCYTCSYTHNYIEFNRRLIDTLDDQWRTKVTTHELGHALALRHPQDSGLSQQTGPKSVMWQGHLPYNTPQAYDIERLKGLYK